MQDALPRAGDDPLAALSTAGIVPVLVIDDPRTVPPLADAVRDSGLRCVEVTLRTPASLAALGAFSARSGLLVGAGTVLDPEQVDRAVGAGARFIVSPGLSPRVVARCLELGVTVLPGAATAGEVLRAREHGLAAVKFFPAQQIGGLPALRALSAALPGVRFVPTGGIGPDEAEEYLREPSVLAVGGSWMVPRDALAGGRWQEIRDLCAGAARIAAARQEGRPA